MNSYSSDTYVSRKPNETQDERNTREFVQCFKYFTEHLTSLGIKVIILSDNPELRGIIEPLYPNDLILLASGEDYVSAMKDEFVDLLDKLCRIPYNEDEGIFQFILCN